MSACKAPASASASTFEVTSAEPPRKYSTLMPCFLVNEAMIAQALDWLAPGRDERVLDLFCGLGNFALPLARHAGEVIGVEGIAGMVERARDNAAANGLDNVRTHFSLEAARGTVRRLFFEG